MPEMPAIPAGTKKTDIPKGLWTKCPSCKEVLYTKELEDNQMVCKHCGHHFAISAPQRLRFLLDEGSWQEYDPDMTSVDILDFKGTKSYTSRLREYKKKTGLKDAALYGTGKIEKIPIVLAIMDFNFLGGSMGSVVGEKITRAIELATEKRLPLIIISASGGARMYEGMFSLMQMAKTSAALARHAEKRLPYISILTNPTMAGVMASFASLGDLILAEPKAMIGFAGARVIKETTHQELPKGFQTAEFLLDRGLIDRIVHRHQMRAELAQLLRYLDR
ncbi:MAG: acetyl-CoA carboxylase, carboxyltransferase subunit beta [Verrucomicrobiae bacterium]|nr:acetyl-CoA carboxylase, carboxyltransferase subunit beta [Verrucomicrobiae bacterium]